MDNEQLKHTKDVLDGITLIARRLSSIVQEYYVPCSHTYYTHDTPSSVFEKQNCLCLKFDNTKM